MTVPATAAATQLKFSIVVPTYKEAGGIERLIVMLDDVFKSNKLDGEIVVVDAADFRRRNGNLFGSVVPMNDEQSRLTRVSFRVQCTQVADALGADVYRSSGFERF